MRTGRRGDGKQQAALALEIPLPPDLRPNAPAEPLRGGGDLQARGQGLSERVAGGVGKTTNRSEGKDDEWVLCLV